MVTIKIGNLLEATETVIGHQVNCCGVAGGLAADIFAAYPLAEQDYHRMIERSERMDTTPLGLTQLTGQQSDGHIIANLFGQFYPGGDYRPGALESALEILGASARMGNFSVALPYGLSCGICGGDWEEVHELIERAMEGVDCVLYKLEGDM